MSKSSKCSQTVTRKRAGKPAPEVGRTISKIDIEKRLKQHATKIKASLTNACESVLAVGRELAEAQELLAKSGRSSRFGSWLKSIGISRQRAYEFLHVFQKFGNCPPGGQFSAKSLTLLAAPSVPESVRVKAKRLAAKNERISAKRARMLINESKQATAPAETGRTPLRQSVSAASTVSDVSEVDDHAPVSGGRDEPDWQADDDVVRRYDDDESDDLEWLDEEVDVETDDTDRPPLSAAEAAAVLDSLGERYDAVLSELRLITGALKHAPFDGMTLNQQTLVAEAADRVQRAKLVFGRRPAPVQADPQ